MYIGGFTITKVEPTTAVGTDPNTGLSSGYKYIRAYFSNSLATLAKEDIEIRNKDTEQLYSVDTVKLSSDGTYADITLFGSKDEGDTTFLQPQTIYTMEIANSQGSDTFEFELPMIDSDWLVTAVDIEKGKLFFFGRTTGYEVGDVYDGNLGTLVGRRVNVGVNSDNEIEKLSVKKANVVYGVMKYYDKEDGTELTGAISDKDYFEDQVTKTKYYMTSAASATTTIKSSSIRRVVDGAWTGERLGNLDDVTYEYTKLVLNSNGTVDCAVVNPFDWFDTVKVADVDGTIIDETTKTSVDLKDYTIEKDGEYITPADLEEDDVIFYNVNADDVQKFAEVYTVPVTGEPSDIDSTSIKIDGTAYKWNPAADSTIVEAKYYNADDDVYAELMADGNIEGQKILNNFDPDLGVTAYLDRRGNIAYIEGIDKEEAETTDTWYVTTSAGEGYSQALTDYLKFKVSDGTEQTIEIPVSQITKLNGIKGSIKRLTVADQDPTKTTTATMAAADAGAEGDTYQFSFVPKATGTAGAYTATDAANAFINLPAGKADGACLVEKGVLVKVTRDENNKVIGLTFPGFKNDATDTYATITKIDGKNSNSLNADAKKIETNDNETKAQLVASTNIWTYTVDHSNDDAISVTKTAFEDFEKTTFALNAKAPAAPGAAGFGPFVLLKGSSVTDVLLRESIAGDGTSDTFKEGATTTTEGIITGYTEKLNKDKDGNYVNTITVLGIDGTSTTFDTLDESIVGNPGKGFYAEIKLDKTTGDLSKVNAGWTATGTVWALNNTSTSTEIHTAGNQIIKLASDSLVRKWTGSKYEQIKLNQIAATTSDLRVSWHDEYYNKDEENELGGVGVHYADFVVVQAVDALPAAEVTFASLAGDTTFAQHATIATLGTIAAPATLSYALQWYDPTADGGNGDWVATGMPTIADDGTHNAIEVTAGGGWKLKAATSYRIVATTTDPEYDTDTESNIVTSDAAVLAGFSTDTTAANIGNVAATTSAATVAADDADDDVCVITTGGGTIYAIDQFGNVIKSLTDEALDVTGAATTAKGSFTYSTDTDGKLTSLKYTSDGSTTHTYTYAGTANTIAVGTHA